MIQLTQYIDLLCQLLTYSTEKQTPPYIVDLIINPEAGAFRSKRDIQKYCAVLAQKLDGCRQALKEGRLYQREIISYSRYFTHFSRHAEELAGSIIEQKIRSSDHNRHLILIVGGDGTSNQVCSALLNTPPEMAELTSILRFPLGTGNDNADGATLEEVYDLLLSSLKTEKIPYLEINAQGLPTYYSFNIFSMGLDAYVVDLTHKMKRIVPGDTYKPMVNIGVLFYELRVKPQPMQVQVLSEQGALSSINLIPEMVVMGTSGKRTYGGKIPILPGSDNICLISHMNIARKLLAKKLLLKGEHSRIEEVQFLAGKKIICDYQGLIPAQIDGEVVWLKAENFPVTIQLHKPAISIIKKS